MKRRPPKNTPMAVRLGATFFLVGEAAPFAPATVASILVTPLFFGFVDMAAWFQGLATVLVTWIAVSFSTRAEFFYGHDARAIVIDEVAGMMVTFLLVPLPGGPERWIWLLAGFVLFRIFDVLKPFPADRAQNLPKGVGVVTDDLVAGLYANLLLQAGVVWLG